MSRTLPLPDGRGSESPPCTDGCLLSRDRRSAVVLGTFFTLLAIGAHGADLNAIVDKSPVAARSTFGIHVLDMATGKTVFARNENKRFLPASNMKVATTALALSRLGPDYRFSTRVVLEESGDLVLVGSGDPSLSGRVYPYAKGGAPGPALEAIQELAEQVVAAGILRVEGDIIGDDRRYPWSPYPGTWTQEDAVGDDGAPVSALTVNDNVIGISVKHGAHPGDLAVLAINPPLEYFAIDNRVVTVAAGGLGRVRVSRLPGSRQLQLWGSIPLNVSTSVLVAVDDPALFAACAFYDALVRRGVSIRGEPRARHRSVSEDEPPESGQLVASRTSPPLRELLQVVDKVSQNLHAELMLRETGRAVKHSGTGAGGIQALEAFLGELGATKEDYALEDGSGLSRNAQVTPRLLTRVLTHMYSSENRETWVSFLPVGGEDGTLKNRMSCCKDSASQIHAKTGTLARSLALSGYADRGERGVLAFSILVNNFSVLPSDVRAWVDKIALALLE